MTSTKIEALIVAMSIALSAPAQAAPDRLTPPAVPSGLEVEAGWNPFLVAHAVGTQNYICASANTSTGVDWLFIGPQATLFENGVQTTNHAAKPLGEYSALGCADQFKLGVYRYDDRLRARR